MSRACPPDDYEAKTTDALHEAAAARGLKTRGVITVRSLLIALLRKSDAETNS